MGKPNKFILATTACLAAAGFILIPTAISGAPATPAPPEPSVAPVAVRRTDELAAARRRAHAQIVKERNWERMLEHAYYEVAARIAEREAQQQRAQQQRAQRQTRPATASPQAGGVCNSHNHSGCIPAKYPCAIPASICGRESGMNINIRYSGPVSSNAAGKYQMLGSTWRHACNLAGHPEWAAQWPSAADAPEEYQDAAAAALWNSPGGPGNWD